MSRVNYRIQFARVIATIAVVLGHSCIIYSVDWNYYTTPYSSEFYKVTKEIINSFQMQLFFSISGFLFFYSRIDGYWEFICKKLKRLLIPFIFILLVWLVPIRYLAHYPLYENSLWNGYKSIFIIDWGHLWFLPTLFLIFILSINIKKIANHYYIVLILFVALLLSFCVKKTDLSFFIKSPCTWFLYFWLGYVLAVIKNRHYYIITKMKQTYMKLTLFVVVAVTLTIRVYYMEIQNTILSINNLTTSFFIILLLFAVLPNKHNKLVEKIDNYSMGIYLFHAPIIYLLYDNFSHLQPHLLVLFNFWISFISSVFLTKIVRLLKLNYIVGE